MREPEQTAQQAQTEQTAKQAQTEQTPQTARTPQTEAERFRRVWARVAPEGSARIVLPAPEETCAKPKRQTGQETHAEQKRQTVPETHAGEERRAAESTEAPDAATLLSEEWAFRADAEALLRRTGAEGIRGLMRASCWRARQLCAAVFLLEGTVCPAAEQERRRASGQSTETRARTLPPCAPSGGLPALYRTLLLLEDGYRALLERAEDPVLAERYAALAGSCREGRRRTLLLADRA